MSTFVVNIGVNASSPATTGTIFAYRDGYASNGGLITVDDENLNGRMIPSYAGITTTLAAAVTNTTTETISLDGRTCLDIRNGDYFTIDDEIVRVKTAPTGSGDVVSVFRGVLGSKRATHIDGSLVRRVFINPIELRRHSIIRASGHTFEYVGYGPGNYSTALPDKHDRELTPEEELLAQSIRKDGGVNSPPKVVDSNNTPMHNTLIGNGSLVNVKFSPYEWTFGNKQGIGLDLQAVQVVDLVEYSTGEEDFEPVSGGYQASDEDIPFPTN